MAKDMVEKVKKEKKPKIKKPKKPKVNKPKKIKKEKKPMSKKKLIIIIMLLLIVAGSAAAGYFLMFDKKEVAEEEEIQEPPKYDYFALDADKIDSITKIVGYRAIADAYGKDIVFEPLPVDGEEVKKKKDEETATEETAKEETATDGAATEDTATDGTAADGEQAVPQETTATYVYTDIETASADVKKYVTYLMDKLGFKEVFPFYIDSPAGYISLSKDSATEGYTIQIDIDYTKDDYTCVLQKIKKPEEKKAAKSTISRKAALDIIKKTPIEVLGIDESLDNLILIGEPGHSTVDGMDCYGVHVYKNVNDNKSTVILGTYYVASDRKTIYKYDVMNDVYTKIK